MIQLPIFSLRRVRTERDVMRFTGREKRRSNGATGLAKRKRKPKRTPGGRYDTQAYGHAIRYGCDHDFPVPEGLDGDAAKQWRKDHRWHPHRLRHNAATRLRKEFGLDVAQVVLGHATLAVTQVYAERDVAAAKEVMRKVG
jgi:hypothetical protein